MDDKKIDVKSVETGFVIDDDTYFAPEEKQKKKPISNILPFEIKTTGFKSLGNIVKVIAFIVAAAIILIHAFAAYALFAFRPAYTSICIAIVLLGLCVALIVLFLIYALGHSINQNLSSL